jgi:hypothetical protein
MTAPILQLPVFDEPFIIEWDASGMGVGAILHQGRGLVAFFSHQLKSWHTTLTAYERKLMGLVLIVCH